MLAKTLRNLVGRRRVHAALCMSTSSTTVGMVSTAVRSGGAPISPTAVPPNDSPDGSSFSAYREWNRTDNWCSLCKEPFNSWNEHRGKRDHVCLEMFFDAMCKEPRNWDPLCVIADYWCTWHGTQPVAGVSSSTGCPRALVTDPHSLRNTNSKKVESLPEAYSNFLNYFDRAHERPRREELFLILMHLRSIGVLKFGEELRKSASSSLRGGGGPAASSNPEVSHDAFGIVQLHGMLVLYKELHAPMLRLFPSSDQKDLSGLTQMAASNYNLETVYVLCGLERIVTPEAMGVSSLRDMNYNLKGIVVRTILGQLRWALEEESLPTPSGIPVHVAVLCLIAVRMLLCEIVFCRLSEYICRVESVWRSDGSVIKEPRSRLGIGSPSSNALPPAKLWNSGMMQIVEGAFHDNHFGTNRCETHRKPMSFFYDMHPKKAGKGQ